MCQPLTPGYNTQMVSGDGDVKERDGSGRLRSCRTIETFYTEPRGRGLMYRPVCGYGCKCHMKNMEMK